MSTRPSWRRSPAAQWAPMVAASMLVGAAGAALVWVVGGPVWAVAAAAPLAPAFALWAALYVVPVLIGSVVGVLRGSRSASRADDVGPATLAEFSALRLRDVRDRRLAFETKTAVRADAATARAVGPLPLQQWARLERRMREVSALEVADLGEREARIWAVRLGLVRGDRPPGHRQDDPPAPLVRTIDPRRTR